MKTKAKDHPINVQWGITIQATIKTECCPNERKYYYKTTDNTSTITLLDSPSG
jgi:hypothetical protein